MEKTHYENIEVPVVENLGKRKCHEKDVVS